ncbi:MAG: 4-hydroxythreonine-4-phosphate dehydrogenase PdxA [Lentisphaeria bacterium]
MIKVVLALTMGDPAGIGPEIVVKAAQELACEVNLCVWCEIAVIKDAIAKFAPSLSIFECKDLTLLREAPFGLGTIVCYQPPGLELSNFEIGVASAQAGRCAYDLVVSATESVIGGFTDAIVTAPINKASINMAGVKDFCGHTELIAKMCDVEEFAMQQSSGSLRVVFVTTHIPLSKVVEEITVERIIKTTLLLCEGIKQEGVLFPRIAVAGINPHAGENGYMGKEDLEITAEAVRQLVNLGLDVSGPIPSDTLFIEAVRKDFDGIVCMYHDQGHIPFKMLAFDLGVNSTLGLPIIRTSVDHGTAFGIAWKGVADVGSLKAAIRLAQVKIKGKNNANSSI